MRTEKNIILIRHAKWLWDNKLKKQSKECRKQAYENNNFRSTGTGKTTTLLNLVDQFIQDGIRPKQIGYFSFTKKAATEAATRAADKFGLDIENDLAFFRTLHSYAFNQLGMTKEKMMGLKTTKSLVKNVAYQLRLQSFLIVMAHLILIMNILQ